MAWRTCTSVFAIFSRVARTAATAFSTSAATLRSSVSVRERATLACASDSITWLCVRSPL